MSFPLLDSFRSVSKATALTEMTRSSAAERTATGCCKEKSQGQALVQAMTGCDPRPWLPKPLHHTADQGMFLAGKSGVDLKGPLVLWPFGEAASHPLEAGASGLMTAE